MSIFDIFKRKSKKNSEPIPLTESLLHCIRMGELLLEGRIKSPYAELMIYQDEVDNGGHSQFFGNLSSTGDLQNIMDKLGEILSDDLKQNLENAYQAHLRFEENYEDEEAERVIDACDNLFFERENEITQILDQYVSVIDFKYFITEQEREQGRRATLYHEFYKGKWDEKTFWKEDSLLLRDEIMHRTGFVGILEELVCDYNYYGSTEIDQRQWNAIRKVACDTGSELQQVILELEPWMVENFKEYAVFTILGI